MIKIITVIGARPQFIKAAALSRVFLEVEEIEEHIIHTGQHFDDNMSEVFFREMDIPRPNYNLDINGSTHGAMTGRMLESIEKVLLDQKPDYLLVYGDTNSTLAGALAAQKLNIPVVHVEAGLRSFNMRMPEETNRILTDRISSLLFCPTETAVHNLKKEGFEHFGCSFHNTGDVMQDAAMHYADQLGNDEPFLNEHQLIEGEYLLATVHRQENTDAPTKLQEIFTALDQLNLIKPVVLPLHPRTRKRLEQFEIQTNVKFLHPQGYFNMIRLIRNSALILTDSGGLQKEAYFFHKFCVTLREQTEWTELVEHGYNHVVGSDPVKINDSYLYFSDKVFNANTNLYGGGNASKVITKHILNHHKSL